MLGSYLTQEIDIESLTGSDEYGEPQYTSLQTAVKCRIEKGRFVIITADERKVTASIRIFLQATPVVQPQYRVIYGTEEFEVIAVNPFRQLGLSDEYQELICEESD